MRDPVRTPDDLDDDALRFLSDRHLATLTTIRADGSPHVVAVGFTWDPDRRVARVITRGSSQKARNARGGGRAAVSQIDGPRWLTLEGPVGVTDEHEAVAEAVRRYARRYRTPREDPERVVLEIAVDRILGRWA
jgi:PPOX class probable F420-dependent enzyme